MIAPNPDEIEITFFGPGYGECIVIHAGSGNWLIIDSCVNAQGTPVATAYLKSLGVKPEKAVIWIAASHWHDNHIKGLADTVEECRSARLAFGGAFSEDEFVAILQYFEDQPITKIDRGGTELLKCLRHAGTTGRRIKTLFEDTVICDFEAGRLAHGERIELRALSPSNSQFLDFLRKCPSYIDQNSGKAKTRLTKPKRNDLSIAMLFSVGDKHILLGSDLEKGRSADRGWQAVISLRERHKHKAHIFKVPHHGSSGAHLAKVWTDLLTPKPWSVITPWIRGNRELPKQSDKDRIRNLSKVAYLTSTIKESVKMKYDRHTLKHIKRSDHDFRRAVYSGGHVTCRWTPPTEGPHFTLHNGAKSL